MDRRNHNDKDRNIKGTVQGGDGMRLIDADALYKEIKERIIWWGEDYSLSDVPGDIADAPTIDAVEVVRCKDCICFKDNNPNSFGEMWCNFHHMTMSGNDYCSYGKKVDGERKTEPQRESEGE